MKTFIILSILTIAAYVALRPRHRAPDRGADYYFSGGMR